MGRVRTTHKSSGQELRTTPTSRRWKGCFRDRCYSWSQSSAGLLSAWDRWISAECCISSSWENGSSRCWLYGTRGGYLLNNWMTLIPLQIKPLTKGAFHRPLSQHPSCTGTSCPAFYIGSYESIRWRHHQRNTWACAKYSMGLGRITSVCPRYFDSAGRERIGAIHSVMSMSEDCAPLFQDPWAAEYWRTRLWYSL